MPCITPGDMVEVSLLDKFHAIAVGRIRINVYFPNTHLKKGKTRCVAFIVVQVSRSLVPMPEYSTESSAKWQTTTSYSSHSSLRTLYKRQ